MREKWKEEFLRKIKTKSFDEADFAGRVRAVLEDEGWEDFNEMPKETVADEIAWHWQCLNEDGHVYSEFPSRIRQNFKRVANHLLENYFTPEDISKSYQRYVEETEDGHLRLS